MRSMMCIAVAAVLAGVAGPARGADGAAVVFIEAEAFTDRGGWVVDQQFMDEMGSPFVLAHGLGRPVRDATTRVTFPAAGTYRLWVRTRDWVAPWKAPGAPGRFQVLVDGKAVKTVFGTEGGRWHWQDGGLVEIARKRAAVALHDLTGFEGRCDAIVFAADANLRPPDGLKALTAWRRKMTHLPAAPRDGGTYDLVVVGGGIAGTCAALSAARLGLRVALVQDRPVLGGNNSSEVRVWLNGKTNFAPYPRIGDVVRELDQRLRAHYGPANTTDLYEDDRKIAVVRAEKNITLMLSHRGNGVEMRAGRIAAVIAQHIVSGRRVRLACSMVADCTGHGVIGALAGADFDMTRKGHMGRCNLWNVAETPKAVPFPRCPWALDLSDKPFPGRKVGGLRSLGVWYWESGFDRDPFVEGEYIRDWNFRAMYGAWDALKNVDKLYPNHKLNWAAYIAGPRESRRLLGDVVLSKTDVMSGKTWPDACVPCTWPIDLHLPDKRYVKGFEGDAFISKAHYSRPKTPYWLPYRCLYSRNVANLFMAGRDISVTHEALGTSRVMRTCGMMGEIVGMAASLCRKHSTTPRGVYAKYLDELKALMTAGIGKAPAPRAPTPARRAAVRTRPPAWLSSAGTNFAIGAKVVVSSNHESGRYPASRINDGKADTSDNGGRWVSGDTPPHTVEVVFAKPQAALRGAGEGRETHFAGDGAGQYHQDSDKRADSRGSHRKGFGVRISRAMVMVTALGYVAAGAMGADDASGVVFVEAESFADLGGWVVDQQAMDQMGSPYLLAHGLGVPVKDATAGVAFPAAGAYRLWVRTRDWVATWKAPGAPGKFQVLIDGKAVGKVFGTEGVKWHWQDGGTVEIASKRVTLALHDLTGFEGRCDAICFTPAGAAAPPEGGKALAAYRRKALSLPDTPPEAGKFDLVIVGGGIAGTCAAISAARLGLDVALVQDRPVLGGNNSSEVRVHLGGRIKLGPYPALGSVVAELSPARRGNAGPPERYEDAKKLRVARAEKNISLFVNTHVSKVATADGRITSVIGRHIRTGREISFTAPVFADCTGDGTVGFLAGADYRMGREGRAETAESLAPAEPDKMTMGSSVQWYSRASDQPSPFADCPWAVQFTEANCQRVTGGEWNWETGMNKHQIDQIEEIRDYGMRVVYGNWAFLKNHHTGKAKYANRRLDWMAYIAGKRESRRLLGDVILRQQDIIGQKAFPDACVTTTWTIDLHYPDPKNTKHFPGREFRSIAKHARIKPYPIPYRCFYSRNVSNLFMAGRDISVTHVALGTVRVMNTCGMMGEVVGMAASICKAHDTTPRGVYKNYLDELKQLMKRGTGKSALPLPPQTLKNPPNISTVAPDLATPKMVVGAPAAGKRVRGTLPKYKGTDVHHALYLPTDWRAGGTFPVIVEYAGNGSYRSRHGDVSDGTVEGSNLGYGISGGEGFIWLCLPYVNAKEKRNQTRWWGDVAATVAYCKQAVAMVCRDYGGDPAQVILAGFSRGAIACNYIGLHDDEIAAMWRAFIPYSHYDGVLRWPYAASDPASALVRLKRLKGRPQLIVHEGSAAEAARYVAATGVKGDFTFMAGPFRNHNDRWAHRDTPQRRYLRAWIHRVLSAPPAGRSRRPGGGLPKGVRPLSASKPPAWLAGAGTNFALGAKVTVSSNASSPRYPVRNINDGKVDMSDNRGRWLSSGRPPHTVEVVFAKPQAVSAARIVSGFLAADGLSAALGEFVLQYHDGAAWKDIPGTRTKGNTINDLGLRFPRVTTSRVRLVVAAAHGGFARLWELALYNPPTAASK